MSKNLFLKINVQSVPRLNTWVAIYVRGPKHAYVGPFLRTQLGFQKQEKCKFSAIMTKFWNESHIV